MLNSKLIRMILILVISGFLLKLLNEKIEKNKNNIQNLILPELNNRYELGILMESLKGKQFKNYQSAHFKQ